MKHLLTLLILFSTLFSFAQRREEVFDFQFKPTKAGGYYYVVTEKTDSGWKRQAWYLAQKTLYMSGLYKDENGKIGHGMFEWYHPNGYLQTKVKYVDGYRDGIFMRFNEQGMLTDSVNYIKGRKQGAGLRFYDNGYLADSTHFDGAGNGTQVSWHDDGSLASAGYWMQDTLKKGRWKYYHNNGQLMATEDYDAAGKLLVCNCYDEKGTALDTALCREKEAMVDAPTWRRFLERNLMTLVEKKAQQGITGNFTVVVRFLVNEEGTVLETTALTNYGYGIRRSDSKNPGKGTKVDTRHAIWSQSEILPYAAHHFCYFKRVIQF
jgi:antitoxin component YwqK of YwqJK toxin-antitoxin module